MCLFFHAFFGDHYGCWACPSTMWMWMLMWVGVPSDLCACCTAQAARCLGQQTRHEARECAQLRPACATSPDFHVRARMCTRKPSIFTKWLTHSAHLLWYFFHFWFSSLFNCYVFKSNERRFLAGRDPIRYLQYRRVHSLPKRSCLGRFYLLHYSG